MISLVMYDIALTSFCVFIPLIVIVHALHANVKGTLIFIAVAIIDDKIHLKEVVSVRDGKYVICNT